MSGGMSHLDTFDPKSSEVRGPMEQVKTKTDGLVLAETLPLLANHSDKIAVIRAYFDQGAHEQGNYFMHTSYDKRGTIVHPSMGSGLQDWMVALTTLPGAVVVGTGNKTTSTNPAPTLKVGAPAKDWPTVNTKDLTRILSTGT